MRLRRVAAVVVLVALLSTSVAAGNAVIAAERTVLSGQFVKATLEEADAYGAARALAIEQAAAPADAGNESPGGPQGVFAGATGRIVEEAVTETYVRREVERNVDRTYGYLHGDRETLVVAVDLTPIQDRVLSVLEDEIRNASLAELLDSVGPGDSSVSTAGTEVDLSVVREMAEGPGAYEAARTEFRADVRGSVLDRLAGEAFATATDDERLELVVDGYDPDDYTAAEKRAMVEEREGEIRAAFRSRVEAERGDEVDDRVDGRLDALAGVEGADLAGEMNESAGGLPPELLMPVADVAAAGIEGLATDKPYGTFSAEVDDAKARLAANASALIEARIEDEGSGQLVLADSREAESAEGLRMARRVVGVVDLLSILLPITSVALVGALWWLTRSPTTTAGGTGVSLLVAGLPGYALAVMASDAVREALAGVEVPPLASELSLAVVDRTFGVLAGQSLALAVVGASLVVAAGYLHVYGRPAWALAVEAWARRAAPRL